MFFLGSLTKNLRKVLPLALVLVSSSAFAIPIAEFEPMSNRPVAPDSEIILGGSFSPPTLEHLGVLTHLMGRFGFFNGTMLVAKPYKKGAVPASVSLGLTRMAVEHVDEVLEMDGAKVKNFQITGPGSSSWVGQGGKTYNLKVDDREIREDYSENALKTLRSLHAQKGDAKKLYWVAGGDSFASVPKWTPEWMSLFDQAHWVVVSRQGFDSKPGEVSFRSKDPLRSVLPAEFLKNYTHYKDETHQIHVYENKDPSKPNIYIVDQPALDDSSSKNRASLAEMGDHEHAQNGLQPTIFKECLTKGYYSQGEQGYRVFSLRNQETYLRWLFKQMERKQSGKLTPDELNDFREMSDAIVGAAEEIAIKNAKRPWHVALVSSTVGALVEHISELKEFRISNLHKKIREVSAEYGLGKFAAIYVAIEAAELLIGPAIAAHLFGPAFAPVGLAFHPNEMIVLPAFFAWNILKRVRHRQRLAGDLASYHKLMDLRNRLMRGDPELITARNEIQKSLGLGDSALQLNIVRSRLPGWIPLLIRQFDDRRVTWHDLNVSTNELKAILGDSDWADNLKESAGKKGDELYAHYLLNAIRRNPQTQARLELFATQRYFKRLVWGEIAQDLTGGYQRAEQPFFKVLQEAAQKIRKPLVGDDRVAFEEEISMVYAAAKVLAHSPELADQEFFWQELANILATGYPNREAKLKKGVLPDSLRFRVLRVVRALGAVNEAFVENGAFPQSFMSSEPVAKTLSGDLIASALTEYVQALPRVFASDRKRSGEYVPLSRYSRGEDLASGNNLTWEISVEEARLEQEFEVQRAAFERGEKYLGTRVHHKKAPKAFRKSLEDLEKAKKELLLEFESFEFDWYKIRHPSQIAVQYRPESQAVIGYAQSRARFETLQAKADELLTEFRERNQILFGTRTVSVTDIDELKVHLAPPCVKVLGSK